MAKVEVLLRVLPRGRRARVALGAVAGAFLLAGIGAAYAALQDGKGVIHACVDGKSGVARIIDVAVETCLKGETALSWNQTGPQGATGATGRHGRDRRHGRARSGGRVRSRGRCRSSGRAGCRGPDGRDRPPGLTGPQGPPGPASGRRQPAEQADGRHRRRRRERSGGDRHAVDAVLSMERVEPDRPEQRHGNGHRKGRPVAVQVREGDRWERPRSCSGRRPPARSS